MRVKSLMVPPGIPDWYTRRRAGGRGHGDADRPRLVGRRRADRAGRGRRRRRVGRRPSSIRRRASMPGAAGAATGTRSRASTSWPAAPPTPTARRSRWRRRWDAGGFGNNAVHRVHVTVRVKPQMADTHRGLALARRQDGRYQTFTVPLRENQTVLDVVTWVQRHADPTLSYRFACRVGMCGVCAMTVNGRPRWTCRTHVSKVVEDGKLEIGPLANLPVIKDLAADMARVLREVAAAPRARSRRARRAPTRSSRSRRRARRASAADAAIECINCGVCYAACDTVRWNEDYLGPAALNRAWTLVNDVRDAGNTRAPGGRRGDGGCHACHSHQSCQEHCPNALNPTASIAGLKRRTMQAYIRGSCDERVAIPTCAIQSDSRVPGTLADDEPVRTRHERAPLRPAAGDRGAHGAAGAGASRRHLLRDQPRAARRRHPRRARAAASAGALFYGVFVLAASRRMARIGVRDRAVEWARPARPARSTSLMWGFGLVLAVLGLRAVAAVVLP